MHRSKCDGKHKDTVHGKGWRDTAGRLWHEYACEECGRLIRRLVLG